MANNNEFADLSADISAVASDVGGVPSATQNQVPADPFQMGFNPPANTNQEYKEESNKTTKEVDQPLNVADMLSKGTKIPLDVLNAEEETAEKDPNSAEPVSKEISDDDFKRLDDPAKIKSFGDMRKRIADQQKIIDELRSTKPTIPDSQELQRLKQENEQMNKHLSKIDLQNSPEFQRKWTPRINSIADYLAQTVKAFDGDPKLIDQAARMNIRQRQDFLTERVPEAVSTLMPVFAELDRTLQARQQELNHAQEVAKHYQLTAKMQDETQRTAFKDQLKNTTVKELVNEGHFVFKKLPGNESWNKQVDTFTEAVNILFATEDVGMQSKALALSVAAPIYLDLYKQERAEREKLEAQLSGTRKATPKIGTSSSTGGATRSGNESIDSVVDGIMSKIF